jgi:SAM-dependent methyltransferase
MPSYYPRRVKRMLDLVKRYQIVRNGDRIIELGTGWLHWEALTLRLFYDIEAILYDVWDNRQLGGLKNYLKQLSELLKQEDFRLTSAELSRALPLLEDILRVESFDELYHLLGFKYVVDGSGSLSQFADQSFQLVVSAGVLEHVKREALPTLISETARILKPGGWALHSIDTSDHLSHYDTSESPKLYLTFADRTWQRLFENEVQYINRVQRCEWLKLFEANCFELLEEDASKTDIGKLTLCDAYARFDKRDLECTSLRVAFRKPV